MKGKYANAAEKRRALEALEQRAQSAERERDRLVRELADATGNHEEVVTAQRVALAEVKRQRDEGVSHRVTELEAINNRLRARWLNMKSQLEHERKRMAEAADRMAGALRDRFGWSGLEARDFVSHAQFAVDMVPNFLEPTGGSRDPQLIRAVQAARGLRGSPGAGIDAPDEVHSRKESRAEAARLSAGMEDQLLPVYVHDEDDDHSVAVMQWGGEGDLLIVIEPENACARVPVTERPALAAAIAGGSNLDGQAQ